MWQKGNKVQRVLREIKNHRCKVTFKRQKWKLTYFGKCLEYETKADCRRWSCRTSEPFIKFVARSLEALSPEEKNSWNPPFFSV